ncbi:MAG TPA: C40 family peptidase, partial [Vicinamibacterales bacterium]|nr:C40 family peptidase [Vicinamibacterales bacterium]
DSAGVRRPPLSLVLVALLGTGCASAGTLTGPAAFPGAPASGATPRSATADPLVHAVTQTALSYVGTPYRLGGDDPSSGFDCSGLVRYALGQHQLDFPRTVAEQFAVGRAVSRREVQTGDLVFFSTIGPGATHVGIVVNPHDASFVHAPATGGVVRVEHLDTTYWASRFVGARRLF